MQTPITWHLEKLSVSALTPYAHNPRIITPERLDDLRKSVNKFGVAEPIVANIDAGHTIIGGHARYLLHKADNILEVDVYLPSRLLTDDEVKELNVRLNKNIAGVWDFNVLAEHFDYGALQEWGFDKAELGVMDSGTPATDFELPSGEKGNLEQITFTLSSEQAAVVRSALEVVLEQDSAEWKNYGNENKNGNALHEIVQQWGRSA